MRCSCAPETQAGSLDTVVVTSTTSSGAGEKSGAGTTTATSTTKTAGGTETTTTTVTPQEGVLLALLGTGAVLVLAGALYTRPTTLKLPGGAERRPPHAERRQRTRGRLAGAR